MTLSGWMLYTLAVTSLVAAAGWFLDRGLGRMSLPSRGVWAGVLLTGVLLPAAMAWSGSARTGPEVPAPPAAVSETAARAELARPFYIGAPMTALSLAERGATTLNRGLAGAVALLPLDAPRERWIVFGWLAASLGLLGLHLGGALRVRRQLRSWLPVRLLGRSVLLSPSLGPAALGLLRPRIVLPASSRGLPPDALELVLRHEEEHVRARDPLLLALGLLPIIAFPWVPAFWWVHRRLRTAIEIDCDRRVLRQGTSLQEYAFLLVRTRLAGGLGAPHAPGLLATASILERRLRAMRHRSLRRGLPASLLAGLTATGLVLTALGTEIPVASLDPAPAMGTPTGAPAADPDPSESDATAAISDEPGPTEPSPQTPRVPDEVEGPEWDASGVGSLADLPQFTPFTVAPRVANRSDVEREMERLWQLALPTVGVSGTAYVQFFIDETGRVRNAVLDESSGHDVIDRLALTVSQVFRFQPARNQDRPAPVWVRIPITFAHR